MSFEKQEGTRGEIAEHLRRVLPAEVTDEAVDRWLDMAIGESDEAAVAEFVGKVAQSRMAQELVASEPGHMVWLWEYRETLDDPDTLENLVHNVRERAGERKRIDEEVAARAEREPLASDEEYELGIYREALESQVRDAVLQLQRKGYQTYSSGFLDLSTGSQGISFETDPSISIESIMPRLEKLLEMTDVVPRIEQKDEVTQLVLIPVEGRMSLHDWEHIWNAVATELPAVEHRKEERLDRRSQFTQWSEFRAKQDALRAGGETGKDEG